LLNPKTDNQTTPVVVFLFWALPGGRAFGFTFFVPQKGAASIPNAAQY